MKTLDGWQRLGIFLTIGWVSGVVLFSVYEYQAVSSGASPTEFVVLRDTKTQKEFGGLSVGEVKNLGALTQKKSRSAESEPGDAEEAKFLLEVEPEPVLRYSKLVIWIALPVVCFGAIFVGIRWVAAGFCRSDLELNQERKISDTARANTISEIKNQLFVESIKGLFLMNGGGAVALSAWLQTVWEKGWAAPMLKLQLCGMAMFGVGVFLAGLSFLARFLAFYHPRTEQPLKNPVWWVHTAASGLSMISFAVAVFLIVKGGFAAL